VGKLFGIAVIVIGIWVGLEVYQNGMGGAFGGVFSGGREEPAASASIPQRAGASVDESYREMEDRYDSQAE
jgi:hypothetical protein